MLFRLRRQQYALICSVLTVEGGRQISRTLDSPETHRGSGRLVSIVLPTNACSEYLPLTLASVKAQSWTNWELILVDDGSDVHEQLVQAVDVDPRIRIVRHAHSGPAASRNRGLEESHGEYIAFLDHDDLWHPDYLCMATEVLDRDPDAVGVFSDIVEIDGEGKETGAALRHGDVDRRTILSNTDCPKIVATVFRRSALERYGAFDPALKRASDVDLIWRYGRLGRFVPSHRLLVYYRWHNNNLSRDNRFTALAHDRVVRKHLAEAQAHNDSQAVADLLYNQEKARRHYAGWCFVDGLRALHAGRWGRGVSLAFWGVRYSPRGVIARVRSATNNRLGQTRPQHGLCPED
jgi:GT2 family glycosyltransferase